MRSYLAGTTSDARGKRLTNALTSSHSFALQAVAPIKTATDLKENLDRFSGKVPNGALRLPLAPHAPPMLAIRLAKPEMCGSSALVLRAVNCSMRGSFWLLGAVALAPKLCVLCGRDSPRETAIRLALRRCRGPHYS